MTVREKHHMVCPNCGLDEDLHMWVTTSAKLLPNGIVAFDPDYDCDIGHDRAWCGAYDYGSIDEDIPARHFLVDE